MSKYFIVCLFFLFMVHSLSAQNTIIESGRILYERKINTYAVLPGFIKATNLIAADETTSFLQRFKNDHPQFWVDSFQLSFNNRISVYQPAGTISPFLHGVGVPMAEKNIVYCDFLSGRYQAEKNAYNERRLIEDTLVKIRWKLTDETREIAGFECRRANALVSDSIYVVAFYSDAIRTKGGPEHFNGLPGMILGVAIPHYNISYFATKVEYTGNDENIVIPSFRNHENKISNADYFKAMISFLKERNQNNQWIEVFLKL